MERIDRLKFGSCVIDNLNGLDSLKYIKEFAIPYTEIKEKDLDIFLNIVNDINSVLNSFVAKENDKRFFVHSYIDNWLVKDKIATLSKQDQYKLLSSIKEISTKYDIDVKEYLSFLTESAKHKKHSRFDINR